MKKKQKIFDIGMLRQFYAAFPGKVDAARSKLGRLLTFSEKVLFAHLHTEQLFADFLRGEDYVDFKVDRVAMQDATAQMALLQFGTAGRDRVAVPSTVHCDHLIQAEFGAKKDMANSLLANNEVFQFLASFSKKYGIGFWKPGAGIIHQIVFENYAFPGGMMIGTDSHTVNAGGLGMIAIGVGGADAVDAMSGMGWELQMPKLIGVKLTGKLKGWSSPKDVILHLAGKLTVKGGTGSVLEYFGPGAASISATGKGTICNMGAEIGATTSTFGYDESMARYLRATGREEVANMCDEIASHLTGDMECYNEPEKYFDQVIEIDLSKLEPHINGPFTPDLAWPLSKFAAAVRENEYPTTLEVGLIGSCTNSSYEDLKRAAHVVAQAEKKDLRFSSEFMVTPGSELIRATAKRDGILDAFAQLGGTVLANACGPCIGQWARHIDDQKRPNSILTSFNRNFTSRNDGNPNTHAFVASPEIVTLFAFAGQFDQFYYDHEAGKIEFMVGSDWYAFDAPQGEELPTEGFEMRRSGYLPPARNGETVEVAVSPDSQRLQLLKPFVPINGTEVLDMRVLIKAKGKCTTDHISMAGPWLKFRGHLDNISNNCYMGAENAFTGAKNSVWNATTGTFVEVHESARTYQQTGVGTIIFGEENLGEGSSREHAAMEPRFLGVKAVVVKSFARIHQTNLKKQGMLALTFANPVDYDLVRQDDKVSILGFETMMPGVPLQIRLDHEDGTFEVFEVKHTYNDQQIAWLRAGSALNAMKN
jgi:aconitate hydratase